MFLIRCIIASGLFLLPTWETTLPSPNLHPDSPSSLCLLEKVSFESSSGYSQAVFCLFFSQVLSKDNVVLCPEAHSLGWRCQAAKIYVRGKSYMKRYCYPVSEMMINAAVAWLLPICLCNLVWQTCHICH